MLREALSRIRRTLRSRGQRGAVIVMVAALMVVLIGAVALVVDVGMVMAYRQQLQKATDASALAAAQDLPNTSDATDTFNDYMARNLPEAHAVTAPEATLTFIGNPVGTMKVECTQQVSLWFARVLGKQSTTIRAVSAAQRVGADLMLVLDRSGSMCDDIPGQPCPTCPTWCHDWQPLTNVKNAGVYLVNQLGEETMMGVVSYNTYLSCDVRLKYLKTELPKVVAGIQKLEPGRNAAMYTDIGGGVRMATDSLLASGRPNPKIIVLITDGLANVIKGTHYDNVSHCVPDRRPLNWVITQANYAKDKHVIIYAVVFGTDQPPASCPGLIASTGEPLMKQVVAITGGVYFRARTTNDLYPIFHEIAGYDFVRLIPAP